MLARLRTGRVWLGNNTAWAGSILVRVAASVLAVFRVAIGECRLRTLVGVLMFARIGGAFD